MTTALQRLAGLSLLGLSAVSLLSACNASMPLASPLRPAGAPETVASTTAPNSPEAAASAAPPPTDAETERRADLQRLQGMAWGLADIPVAQAFLDEQMRKVQAAGPQPPVFAKVVIRPKLSYNAATTASGLIAVDLGWLKSIDSEAELTALLAHEYGHLVREHLVTKNRIGTAAHYATLAANYWAAKYKVNNTWTMTIMDAGWSEILLPNWSRDQEYEADAFALQTTHAMGFGYVSGVKAFLDRIESVERSAKRKEPPPPANAPAAKEGTGVDNHPPIAERINRTRQLALTLPRQRPVTGQADRWKAVLNNPEFKSAESEYLLAITYFEGTETDARQAAARLTQELNRRPAPPRTAMGLAAAADINNDPARKVSLLKAATSAPDASFRTYRMLAHVQRKPLGLLADSADTLQAGLARFDTPAELLPDAIEDQREGSDMIDTLPRNQVTMGQSLFQVKNSATVVQMNLKCMLQPAFAEMCAWAAKNVQQRQEELARRKSRDAAMAKSVEKRLDKMFK
ncbi:M48 family metalloprotease [Ideonella margarita]|uniref:M48 family metalloprotease n=1 Tax=Ideonella margarita TaxID=2984191 RepID=A0ABU9C8X8_9BURK